MGILNWFSGNNETQPTNDKHEPEQAFLDTMEAAAEERGFAFRREPLTFVHDDTESECGFWVQLFGGGRS